MRCKKLLQLCVVHEPGLGDGSLWVGIARQHPADLLLNDLPAELLIVDWVVELDADGGPGEQLAGLVGDSIQIGHLRLERHHSQRQPSIRQHAFGVLLQIGQSGGKIDRLADR